MEILESSTKNTASSERGLASSATMAAISQCKKQKKLKSMEIKSEKKDEGNKNDDYEPSCYEGG